MNLYAYMIDGIPLTEILHWTMNRLQGNAPFIASDTLPPGDYVDVSSIENWSEYGKRTGKDYKFIRNEIKLLAAPPTAWSLMTLSEKDICVKLFVVDKSQRDELYTTDEQILLGHVFHGKSIKARDQRWSHAEMELMNRLTKNDWRTMGSDLNKDNLVSQYVENGLEGTLENDEAALFDYIDARNGTPYGTGNKGFRNKNFTPIDIVDLDALADLVLDIIQNGNY